MTPRKWTSDIGFRRWQSRNGGEFAPFVKASTYQRIDCAQELGSYVSVYKTHGSANIHNIRFAGEDFPLRAVAMKGSLKVLICNYSHTASHIANGWAERVAKRYLRRIRHTSGNYTENREFLNKLANRLRAKFYVSRSFDLSAYEWDVFPPPWWSELDLLADDRGKKWENGLLIACKIPRSRIASECEMITRSIASRKAKERAILQAVYDLGLINPGEL